MLILFLIPSLMSLFFRPKPVSHATQESKKPESQQHTNLYILFKIDSLSLDLEDNDHQKKISTLLFNKFLLKTMIKGTPPTSTDLPKWAPISPIREAVTSSSSFHFAVSSRYSCAESHLPESTGICRPQNFWLSPRGKSRPKMDTNIEILAT